MGRKLQRTSQYWIIVLLAVSTLTESRLLLFNNPSKTRGNVPPQVSAVTQKHGTRPAPVRVVCHPDSLEVVVQADVFDTEILVDGKHFRLGSDPLTEGSPCGAVPSGEAGFSIRAHLMDCGTKLTSTKEKIVYSNVLVYSPEPSSDGLFRLDGSTIPLECHYDRKYEVDGISLRPTWVPHVSKATANSQIDFTLQLMTDDWQFQRGSYTYFLGDPIHFQVSVIMGNHMPLRVYVDHCVATATPDAEATLRYDFIEHHGCLADAFLTKSSSRFLPRVEERTLRFQLDAFRFHQEPSNQVYITCYLKAVPVTLTVSSQDRACSFIDNRWQSIDGGDQACTSCDVSRRIEEPPPTEQPTTTTDAKAPSAVAPEEPFVQNASKHNPAYFFRVHPGMHQSQKHKPQQSSARWKRESGYKATRTVQLGPLVVLPSSKRVL